MELKLNRFSATPADSRLFIVVRQEEKKEEKEEKVVGRSCGGSVQTHSVSTRTAAASGRLR